MHQNYQLGHAARLLNEGIANTFVSADVAAGFCVSRSLITAEQSWPIPSSNRSPFHNLMQLDHYEEDRRPVAC